MNSPRPISVPGRRASALVVSLFAVALLAGLVVTFLTVAGLNRRISAGSAAQTRVDRLAQVALQTVVDDFQAEIVAGSVNRGTAAHPAYVPREAVAAVPATNLDLACLNAFRATRGGSSAWSGSAYASNGPVRSLAGNPSSAAALNRAGVSATRWNKPKLMGTAVPAGFVPPDWVLVSRRGVAGDGVPFSLAAARDASATNGAHVIGRYAALFYDVGGLVDANVAGTSLTGPAVTERGRMYQVALTNLPGVTAAGEAAYVAWRNATNDPEALLSSSNLFLGNAGGVGSQLFSRRQDLLNYAAKYPDRIPAAALPHLTFAAYGMNRIGYGPPAYTGKPPGAAASYAYPNATNADFLSVTNAAGPVVFRRFPLSRIDLLRTGTAADLAKYFGLTGTAGGSSFTYGDNPIKTLADVAAAGREPNFFELLKAAVLNGSLGLSANVPSGYRFADVAVHDASADLHILQIGADIIDQYDADNYPTVIHFGTDQVAGIENIPYLYTIWVHPFRPATINGVANDFHLTAVGAFRFQFWNPHQNASDSLTQETPTLFRVIATSGSPFIALSTGDPWYANPAVRSYLTYSFGANLQADNPGYLYQIRFKNVAAFAEPTTLRADGSAASVTQTDGRATLTEGGLAIAGLYFGQCDAPDSIFVPFPVPGLGRYKFATYNDQGAPNIEVQYKDKAGFWQSYQRFPGVRFPYVQRERGNDSFSYFSGWNQGGTVMATGVRLDPRGSRFGFEESFGTDLIGTTTRPTASAGDTGANFKFSHLFHTTTKAFPAAPSYNVNSPEIVQEASYSENVKSGGKPYYYDLDGVVRRADGRPGTAFPLATGQTAARPRMLNRPFRSVGELSYVFRDLPWKTLDLGTGTPDAGQTGIPAGVASADSGLLEVFSLDDTSEANPVASSTNNVVGGKLFLNGRDPVAVQAVLQGAIVSEAAGTTLSAAQAQGIATNLVQKAQIAPLVDKSELASKLGAVLAAPFTIKTEQDAAVRVLGEIGQADTWNILADLIVQSGRFPPSAARATDFTVDAEVRLWVHIAIDRRTGKVVATRTEIVDE